MAKVLTLSIVGPEYLGRITFSQETGLCDEAHDPKTITKKPFIGLRTCLYAL